jgi:hypothetical protein
MKRRDFLKHTASAAALVVPSLNSLAFGQGRVERRGAPKRCLSSAQDWPGCQRRTSSHRQVTTSPSSRHAHGRVVASTRSAIPFASEVRQRLGSRFDPRSFHDAVLEDGAVPLPMLRTKMERIQ